MNRRTFLAGIAGVAGGLVLPPSVGEVAAEVERRYWALGAMPGRDPRIIDVWEQDFIVTERFNADIPWRNVYTGFVVHVDRSPWLGLQYLKVPSPQNTVSISVEWVK